MGSDFTVQTEKKGHERDEYRHRLTRVAFKYANTHTHTQTVCF